MIDNLKAAVTRADWFNPDLNPKIVAFCEHYGTVILPTRVRTPRHKRQVLRGEHRTSEKERAEQDDDNAHDAHGYASVRDL